MSQVTCEKRKSRIIVKTHYWRVEHDLKAGGCWTSIVFKHGSGKNLLAAPVSARVRNLEAHPATDNSSPNFFEQKFEKNPRVWVEETAAGVAVVSEGELRLKSGESIGIRYRHRVEYRDWGLVACELTYSCPKGRSDIVEVVAFDLSLRPGLTDAYVRENPVVSGNADLTGMGKWFRLGPGGTTYAHRYVPMHAVVFERGVEGIEFSAPSDIHGWNTAFSADPGLGHFHVGAGWDVPGGTLLSAAPYCVAYRRNPTTLKGTTTLRWYFGLPVVKPKEEVFARSFHAGTGSNWLSDAEIEELAAAGVKLLRFHNDYREDGPFWHDGTYPPYDAAGMKELRRIVEVAHRAGMKVIPYISVKELHPDTPGCKENQEAWRQQPGPAFPEVHTWYGSGEFGQLMCLESGWLDFRKESIEIILRDLPWDGLYFDWETPHGCRNPHHLGGGVHSDQDAFYDFMFWVRERVGPEGVILSHLSGLPQIVVENMSTAALIYEDQGYFNPYPEPPDFPPQCQFMPIIPRHLCAGARAGTPGARKTIMSGILQGTPGVLHAIGGMTWDANAQKPIAFTREFMGETRLLAGEGLDAMKFARATDGAVVTGADKVYGALWYAKGKALVYLGNFSDTSARGTFTFNPSCLGKASARKKVSVVRVIAANRTRSVGTQSAAGLKRKGVTYALKPWGSALYRIQA